LVELFLDLQPGSDCVVVYLPAKRAFRQGGQPNFLQLEATWNVRHKLSPLQGRFAPWAEAQGLPSPLVAGDLRRG